MDHLFDDDEEESSDPKPELTEEEAREKRYQEEAAQKLTRGGGLDEPEPRVRRGLVVGVAAGVLLLGSGAIFALHKARGSEQVSERETLRSETKKPGPIPAWATPGGWRDPPRAGEPDAYDKVDPKDPAFTTPITALPAQRDAGFDDSDCPAEYTPDECVAMEQRKMAGEGDPKGKGQKYMGSSYAANTSHGGKPVVNADWEDEGIAPLGYFAGTGKREQPTYASVAPMGDLPMSLPAQSGLTLPSNLKQALEKAAAQQSAGDPDDVKEDFAARPGVLDGVDDERELADCELTAGTVIHVSNLSAINTDVPAKSSVTAMVTQTVYCGADSQHVAIPQGSVFTASANARVSYGDERIQLCMEQLRRPPSRLKPNGSIVPVKCWAAADITGMVGWDGEVDNHWDKLIAGVALSTFLSLGTTASAGNQEGFAPTIAQRAASQAGQQLNQAGNKIVQRDLQRKPTITRKMLQSGSVVITENRPIAPWVARLARRRAW